MDRFENHIYIILRYYSDCDFSEDPNGDCVFDLSAFVDNEPKLLEEMMPKRFLERAEHYEGDVEKALAEVDSLTKMWSLLFDADGLTLLSLKLLRENREKIEDSECYHYKDPKAWYRENLVCWFRVPIVLEI